MSIYQIIAEKLQYIAPEFYKERFFKSLRKPLSQGFKQKNTEPELFWIKDFLSDDAVFFDIGANVGAYLFQLEKKLKPQHIVAFEPNKDLYQRLKRIFPLINIYPLAISDENTMAEFKIPVINGKRYHSRGTLQVGFLEEGENKQLTQKVKVMKLDDWAGLESTDRIDFIKIDVEGNEMQTLRGAKKVIAKFSPVLMVEMEQRHHEKPLYELVSEVESWGYAAHFLHRETMQLQPVNNYLLENQNKNTMTDKQQYINNIIFIPHPKKTNG